MRERLEVFETQIKIVLEATLPFVLFTANSALSNQLTCLQLEHSTLYSTFYSFNMDTKITRPFWKQPFRFFAFANRIRIADQKLAIFRAQGGPYYNVSRDFGDTVF